MRFASDLDHPEVARVDSIDGLFDALAAPERRAALMLNDEFPYQAELERFNREGEMVYVVVGAPLSGVQDKLDRHLHGHGLHDRVVRESFVEHLYDLCTCFVRQKGLSDGRWDLTLTSTILTNTRQREWHIDSYDASGRTYQMTKTCAGWPGTLLSVTEDFDVAAFRRLRDERREREAEYKARLAALDGRGLDPLRRRLARRRAWQEMERYRARAVREMEEVLMDMEGVASRGRELLLIKSGEVPHSSPVSDKRRLVFTMVEFDEYMDTSHADREY
jgi:hypothetical protein